MPAQFADTFDAIANAKAARDTAATEYQNAKAAWEQIEEEYADLTGAAAVKQSMAEMAATYGPTLAKWIGGPAAGAAVAGVVADPGAFAGLGGVFGKLLGVLGLG
ncbi:MAG: hypothetical protein IH626_06255 [Rhodospirillales bacterium]|nr:hypothetical protein [Rhodospirillales bacterium]